MICAFPRRYPAPPLIRFHQADTGNGPEASFTAPTQAVLTADLFGPDEEIEELTIPEGVKELADGFMKGRLTLTKVNLPASLKRIGCEAFSGCANLSGITLPDVLEKICRNAFKNVPGYQPE